MKISKKNDMKARILHFWLCAIFISASIFLLNGFSQDKPEVTVIKDVRIFDGEKLIPRGTVIVKGSKLVEIGEGVSVPAGAEVVDGEGLTLLPGLIDAHVHVLYPQVLRQSLIFGVTTMVDMHMAVGTMKAIKKQQTLGKTDDMATLISAGTLVTVPGGHGTQFGMNIPTITKPEEAQEFVDARIAEGSDFIKIIYDDGSALSTELPTLDKPTLTAVIEAAHNRGKLAVVHIMSLREAREVIEAGADGLAHLFCDDAFDEEFGRLVAQHKAFVIPTLSVLESITGRFDPATLIEDAFLLPFLKEADIAVLRRPFPRKAGRAGYEAAEKAIRQLKAEGVPLLAGTDVPNQGTAYGASLHRELELLVRAGLTPIEALRAATSVPAKTFNLTDRGRIQPGLNADLLLVRGDPTEDIKATRNIVTIWKNGVKADRVKYLRSVQKEREAAERQRNAPPPVGSESGLISDFEEAVTANFGSGWGVSTDAVLGGKSQAEFQWTEGGAEGSKGSMFVKGTIVAKGPFSWAGVMFSPGQRSMSPANLSSKKTISFWAKGKGKSFSVMIFSRSFGFSPSILYFRAGTEWEKYVFPFEKFGTDGHDVWGIFIGASGEKGEFTLQIDDVRLD